MPSVVFVVCVELPACLCSASVLEAPHIWMWRAVGSVSEGGGGWCDLCPNEGVKEANGDSMIKMM